jgi:hypothetical protein
MDVSLHIYWQLKLLYRNEEVELENINKKFYNKVLQSLYRPNTGPEISTTLRLSDFETVCT